MERKRFFCKGIRTYHQQQTAQAPQSERKVRSRPVPKLGPFEIDHKSAAWTPLESAQNPGYFAPQGWLPTPGLRVAGDRPTGVRTAGWLKSAAGRAAGRELRTRGSAHWTGLYGAKERTSGDAAGYKSWPEGRSGRFGPRQPGAGLGADLWVRSAKLALTRSPAPRSCVRTPMPDPWGAFGRNPTRSGRHGERHTKTLCSRRVRFCRHPSRPRVEWPHLPGRGTR